MSETGVIPAHTTLIDVYLKNPNGHPLTNTRFIVKPIRAGFWNGYVGFVEDKEELYCTDENGYVQLHLWPLPYPYILTYSYNDNAVPGYFIFYVPESDTVVRLQDLIVTTTVGDTMPYDETILAQIVAAKAQVTALVDEAKVSESAAASSATTATNAASVATTKAAQTDADRQQVALTQEALQEVLSSISSAVTMVQGIKLQNILKLGTYSIWVDSLGRLRIMNGEPADKETDGIIVGTQV